MRYVFPLLLFSEFIIAGYFAIHFLRLKENKYYEDRLFSLFCIGSAVWSLGFSGVFIQTDPEKAYWCRAFGMIGTFLYLIMAQVLLCHISQIEKKIRYLLNGIAFTGVFVYFFSIKKDQVVYKLEDMGMSYYFKPGLCNNVYTVYTLIVAMNLLFVVIYMIRQSKAKRIQAFGKKLFLVEMIIVFGMILDTVFPLMGIRAIPGSSIAQFLGMIVFYHAVESIARSRINISNMSEFIYYSLDMPVLVYDSERKLQILNDAARDFFQVDRDKTDIKAIKISRLFNMAEEEVFDFEEKSRDIDGICKINKIYCSLAVNKINDTYGDLIGYIIIVTDLSERMKTVERLEEAIEEAECANQAKSRFLANMSHEIRTPMNAIIGFSELVLKADINQQVREYVEDIKGASNNLLAIINDILDISKIESGKMELVCENYYVEPLLTDIAMIISNQAKEKGLEFFMKTGSGIPSRLFGDKVRIRSVLVNLLNNAVKYTEKGKVVFEVNVSEKTEQRVTLEFKISDTGVGIKKEDQQRLFQRFEQMDRKLHYGIEGSGLGLAIVKGYVDLMDGKVTVESSYGKGSVFTVVLEQQAVGEEVIDDFKKKEGETFGNNGMGNMKISGVRVLVVDDNQVNLKVADNSLSYYGLSVDTASSGKEAIECCQQNHYQIVFMDEMMPEMDGIEAMKRIRKADPYYEYGGKGKIIALTADAISGTRTRMLQEGFDEYLGKPMNFKVLERILMHFLPKECFEFSAEESDFSEDSGEEELQYLKEALPMVEVEQGVSNCGGEIEDYLNVLNIAYQYGEKQLEELKTLKEQKDYENYTIKIHSMKSTTRNLGAIQLSDKAKKQEMAGKEGEYSYIDEHMQEFQEEYKMLLANIETVLEKYQLLEEKQKEEKEVLGEEMTLHILSNIRNYVENFDFIKVFDILEEVKKYQISEEYQPVFEKINEWMEVLAVDEIKGLIDETIKTVDS